MFGLGGLRRVAAFAWSIGLRAQAIPIGRPPVCGSVPCSSGASLRKRRSRCEPASSIIEKFGGHEKLAEITGRHLSRVYRWTYPASKGGTDGSIPLPEAKKLLAFAKTSGISVSPADFFALTAPSDEAAQ